MSSVENRLRLRALGLLCLALACGGCTLFTTRRALPPMPRQQLLQALRQRSAQFSTVVDGDISLSFTTTTDGKKDRSPKLGGVLAFDRRLPGLWLRAEKVGRQIFDLRAEGLHFSLLLPQSSEVVTGGPIAYAKLPYLIRPDEIQTMFGGPEALGLSWSSTLTTRTAEGESFRVDVFGAPLRTILVDPGSADILRIRDFDVLGRTVTDIRLSDYEDISSGRFPLHLNVDRPLDGVQVDLRLGDPKLNKEIPLQFFQGRQPAGYTPIDLDRQPLSDVKAFTGEQ